MLRNKSSGYETFAGSALRLFTDSDLQKIHLATLEVLRYTGIHITDEEALDYYEEGGAFVDRKNQNVKLPSYLIEEAIKSAPESVFLAGRDPKDDIILEDGRVYFCPFGVGIYMQDIETGNMRETSKQDVADIARIVDYLDEYDFLFDTVVCRDAEPPIAGFINGFEASLNNTYKPALVSPDDKETAQYLIDMALAVAGSPESLQDRPFLLMGSCTISPLTLPDSTTAAIMTAAKYNIPNLTMSMAMSGGMAPITLAGALVVHNSELLAGLVLSQLVRKGAPFVYASSTGTMDMRHNAAAMVGTPELALVSAAVAAIARKYKIPTLVAGL